MNYKRGIIVLACIVSIFLLAYAANAEDITDKSSINDSDILHVFWGEICPSCEETIFDLRDIDENYENLTVIYYEVYNISENRLLLEEKLAARGIKNFTLPVIIFKDRVWYGESGELKSQIASELEVYYNKRAENGADSPRNNNEIIKIPFTDKSLNIKNSSAYLITGLIAFIDGFNPCSLWVLTFLLGFIIYSGSRKKVLLLGSVFLLTTAIVYGFFISGIFNLINIIRHINWLRYLIALIAIFMAVINIKDYFFFKKGISLSIPEKYKPAIYKKLREITQTSDSKVALISTTVIAAIGITLIELPCTGGFPLLWSNIIASREINLLSFITLLLLYLIIYLLDEMIIFTVAVYTLNISKLSLKQGQRLKLIGGIVMLALGLTYMIDYSFMENYLNLLYLFGFSLLLSLVIIALDTQVFRK